MRVRSHEEPCTAAGLDAGTDQEPVKLAIAMDHPAQQFARALQLLAAEQGVRAHVHYWRVAKNRLDPGFGRPVSWDMDLLEGYPWSSPEESRSTVLRMLKLWWQLRKARPEVVVCYGWASAIARAMIVHCALSRSKLLLYGDTTWQHSTRGRYRVVRSALLRILMRLCAGAVSTGTFNREFYIKHGMDPRRIMPGVCPADTQQFELARTQLPSKAERTLRIGFAGKLIPRKGLDELLRAAGRLPHSGHWSLTVVGDGPQLADYRKLTAELGLGDKVTFHGFANTSEMPGLLAGFDIVVVPSRLDMRVLVTIEAMAAGAAVVVSDATAVWGAGDLIEDGVTGLVFRSGDPLDLAVQLRRLLDEPDLLASLRQNGAARTAHFGPEAFARSMMLAAQRCLTGSLTVR